MGRNSLLENFQDLKLLCLLLILLSFCRGSAQGKSLGIQFFSGSLRSGGWQSPGLGSRWRVGPAKADGRPGRPRSLHIDMFLKGWSPYLSPHRVGLTAGSVLGWLSLPKQPNNTSADQTEMIEGQVEFLYTCRRAACVYIHRRTHEGETEKTAESQKEHVVRR